MKEYKTADQWCRRISNAARFMVAGDSGEWISMNPCCFVWTPNNTVETQDDVIKVRNDIVEYVHNNKETACNSCINRDKNPAGKRSLRSIGNEVISADDRWGDIKILEFQIDTRCNAACVMCSPTHSTLWQQELKIPVTSTERSTEQRWNTIAHLINWNPVERVYFSGGEPLLTSTHEKILSNVPDLSTVELKYQTNAGVSPSAKTLDIWRQVRRVVLEISLDGTNEQYNYIRYPLEWDLVEANIKFMVKFFEENNIDSEIHINCTVNPLNLLYLKNLDVWFSKIQSGHPMFKTLEYDACHHPAWGIDKCTPEIVEAFKATHGKEHPAMLILGRFNPTGYQTLIKDLTILDQRRGLDWKSTFNKAVEFYQKGC